MFETIMYYWELGKRLNKEYGTPKKRGENTESCGTHRRAIQTSDASKQLIKKLKEIGITICERKINKISIRPTQLPIFDFMGYCIGVLCLTARLNRLCGVDERAYRDYARNHVTKSPLNRTLPQSIPI